MIARQIFNPDGSNLRRWDYVIDPGHNMIQSYTWRYREGSVRTLGVGHDKSQSRIAEAPTGSPTPTIFQQRAYYYDALERVTGTLHYEVSRSTVEIYNPWWHREILGPNLFGETAHNAFDSVNVGIATPIDRPNACRYDPVGRMWDPCDDNGPSSLAFDGENVVRTGGDLALARYTFLHGPGVDDPLLGHRTGGGVGETVIYITNGRGEVFSIARASGHASLSQSSSHNPTYAGASNNLDSYENNRTGAFNASLVYYRNRFYDPETARWTQEDPIGVAGGVNLFAYGNNNPASNTDRFGLAPEDTSAIPIRAVVGLAQRSQIDMSDPGPQGGPKSFGQCVARHAIENFKVTNAGIWKDPALAAWRVLSGAALGALYVSPTGAPGPPEFAWRTLRSPVSRTPSFFIPTGARAGTLLKGRPAVNAVVVRAVVATAVVAGGFQLGVALGSAGVGTYECLKGAR